MPCRKLPLLLAIGVVLSFSGVLFAQSNLYTFPGPDVDLGPSYLGRVVSGGHYIGGRGDTVYVLREYGHTYCHKSTDGSQTFGAGVRVNSTAGAYNASLKVDSAGVVYVAYQSDDADIYFTKSTDGGQTFTPDVKVNDDIVPQTGQEKPVVAVNNSGQVFVAWSDQRNSAPGTHQSIFFSASHDNGSSFSQNVQINDSSTLFGAVGLDIGVNEEGYVYVAWGSYYDTLFISRSTDSGRSFPLRVPVSTAVYHLSPSLTDSVVGIVWGYIGNAWLRFSVSCDYGQNFDPDMVIDSSGQPQFPSLVWKNGIFYATWRASHQRTPSGPDLDHMWFSYSRDSSQSFVLFVDAVPDDTNFVPHFNPSVWVNENRKVFVAWSDARWDPTFKENHHLFVSVGVPLAAKGDLNLDGGLTIADVVMELNAVFLGQSFPAPFEAADGNCDGQLSSADISLLLLATFLGSGFPCG